MSTASLAPARLLIVDDQPANIRVMAEALQGRYELFFATTGAKALELVKQGEIDLALLDVVLPDLDGFEVCRRLKADEATRGVPVIFVTAKEEENQEALGFEVGGVDYITKPIRPSILRARVNTHLSLKAARDKIEQMAMLDPLTGIANRRRFDNGLAYEWNRAVRGLQWVSIAFVDVDYFKRYNDTYGHSKGDECLQAVAGALSNAARRPSDLVARYGGEEFAMVLPDTDATGMRLLMRATLGRLRELRLEHAASDASPFVSVSVGAVSLIPSPRQTAAEIIAMADELLYEVKKEGRNHCLHLNAANGKKQRIDPPEAAGVAEKVP